MQSSRIQRAGCVVTCCFFHAWFSFGSRLDLQHDLDRSLGARGPRSSLGFVYETDAPPQFHST